MMALDPKLIENLLGPHPARRIPYDELREGLMRNVAAKNVNVSRDGDLELFGYSSLCNFDQKWDLFSLIARGLILDHSQRRVVATPFPKFFNFGEGGTTIPDDPFEVTEKIDGSLGILFRHRDRWRISTRGQLGSEQGAWATQHLHQRVNLGALAAGTTYLVEIVYPENRVVIPYDFEGLVLLGAYDEQGHEPARAALQKIAEDCGMRIARSVACESFDALLRVAQTLPRAEEGFVLRFNSGLRLKLKGEAYCRVHKLICNCTPLALWEAMMHAEDVEAMRRELPEEMRKDFDTIRGLIEARFNEIVNEVRAGHERFGGLSDKELGLMLQNTASEMTVMQRKFIFACRRQDFLKSVDHKGEWREKLFKAMRPDGNRLAGYVPSNAMTRFEAEM